MRVPNLTRYPGGKLDSTSHDPCECERPFPALRPCLKAVNTLNVSSSRLHEV